MSVPAPWFSSVIADGMQRLAAMRLMNAPQDDALALACAVWIDSLWFRRDWHQDPDEGRLRHAFMALAGSSRRWPAPVEVIDNLPAKPPQLALPGPRHHRTGQAHLVAMKQIIASAWTTH